MSLKEFGSVFRDLSHHLFPDGCPEPSLDAVWPRSNKPRRRNDSGVTSSSQALQSLKNTRDYAKSHGLSMEELFSMVWVCHRMATATDIASVLFMNEHHLLVAVKLLLPKHRHSITSAMVTRLLSIRSPEQQTIVLRFLTLAIQTGDWLDLDAIKTLTASHSYAVVFQASLQPTSCADAVRLLLRITCVKHTTKHRIRRIEIVMARHGAKVKALAALLGLMKTLSDVTTCYVATVDDNFMSNVPDQEWARDLTRCLVQEPLQKKSPSMLLSRLSQPIAYSGRLVELLSSPELHKVILLSKSERLRLRTLFSTNLVADWFESPPAGSNADFDSMCRSRLELLSALGFFVRRTGWMSPEMERFMMQAVLPNWDGKEEPFGNILCRDLLPYLPKPPSLGHAWQSVLQSLENHFIYGDRAQQNLIMIALSELVSQWSGTLRTPSIVDNDPASRATSSANPSDDVVNGIIVHVNNMLLKGYLLQENGNELLRMATVEFFEAISDLGLGGSSERLAYRLLQSPSALSIDRLCQLLALERARVSNNRNRVAGPPTSVRTAVNNASLWKSCAQIFQSPSSNTIPAVYRGIGTNPGKAAEIDASSALGVRRGVAFAGYASGFLQDQRANGTISSDEFHDGNQLDYLHYLKSHGFSGTHDLLV